jgi:four helix bundle protein
MSEKYQLEERTENFSLEVINFCKEYYDKGVLKPLFSQLIRSATSIGANYSEANAASSRKDFKNKIYICKKEAQETCYWLRLVAKADKEKEMSAKKLEDEAHQFVLIFGKILSTMTKNSDPKSELKIKN